MIGYGLAKPGIAKVMNGNELYCKGIAKICIESQWLGKAQNSIAKA